MKGARYELLQAYEADDKVASSKMTCISFKLSDIFDSIRMIGT